MSEATFKCRGCGGVFECGWTETEARAEQHTKFPGVPDNECMVVCDECFQELMKRLKLEEN